MTDIKKPMISFPLPKTEKARFIRRLNRFVAEVEVDGRKMMAHVPSSGRMFELLVPGADVYVSRSDNPARKTDCTLLLVRFGTILVSIDSLLPNRIVYQALREGSLPWFSSLNDVKREVPFGESRFDFLLGKGGTRCFLEVKSVTLAEGGVALFPDAPTARGARHLRELIAAVKAGYRAGVIFVAQRNDVNRFSPNDTQDEIFGEALREAASAEVEVYALTCKVSVSHIELDRPITVDLTGGIYPRTVEKEN